MARGKYNVYAAECPTRQALDRIADKWTALIVGLLSERTHRFGELRRSIEGISHKVLVQTLRSLERDGLVHREPIASSPPTLEYSLTELGRTLVRPLASIRDWAEEHIEELQAARKTYSREHQTPAQRTPKSTERA
jgi:DNA-binding HxlR family transcriptional regulator